jgi:hypothetical protein
MFKTERIWKIPRLWLSLQEGAKEVSPHMLGKKNMKAPSSSLV